MRGPFSGGGWGKGWGSPGGNGLGDGQSMQPPRHLPPHSGDGLGYPPGGDEHGDGWGTGKRNPAGLWPAGDGPDDD